MELTLSVKSLPGAGDTGAQPPVHRVFQLSVPTFAGNTTHFRRGITQRRSTIVSDMASFQFKNFTLLDVHGDFIATKAFPQYRYGVSSPRRCCGSEAAGVGSLGRVQRIRWAKSFHCSAAPGIDGPDRPVLPSVPTFSGRHGNTTCRKGTKLIHHDVDGFLELQNSLPTHIHGDFLDNRRLCHGDGHVGNAVKAITLRRQDFRPPD